MLVGYKPQPLKEGGTHVKSFLKDIFVDTKIFDILVPAKYGIT